MQSLANWAKGKIKTCVDQVQTWMIQWGCTRKRHVHQYMSQQRKRSIGLARMCAITVVTFAASTTSMKEADVQFDADSVPI